MMTFQRLASYVSAEPFRPFRIRMASGQMFEIRHPEMVSVGRTTVHIYTHMIEDSNSKQQQHEVSMLLIESIERMNAAMASDNG